MFEESNSDLTMMNVGIMWKEVAKYDNGYKCIGRQMVNLYDHDKNSLKMWRASANFIYNFTNKNKEWILRVTPSTERTIKQIQAELDFMEYLREQGLPVLKPELSSRNILIETDDNEIGTYHSVLFPRAPGKYLEFTELTKKHWIKCGRMMGRLHTETLNFKPHKDRRRRSWKDDIKNSIKTLLDNDSDLIVILKHLMTLVEEIPKDNFFGLIHYDLCYDNIIWNNDSYVMIDFDDAAYYPFVADVAFGIDDIRDLSQRQRDEILQWFSTGYLERKDLPKDWLEQLEIFFDLEDSLKYSRVLHAYEETDQNNYPEWLIKLQKRHFTLMSTIKERLKEKWLELF